MASPEFLYYAYYLSMLMTQGDTLVIFFGIHTMAYLKEDMNFFKRDNSPWENAYLAFHILPILDLPQLFHHLSVLSPILVFV